MKIVVFDVNNNNNNNNERRKETDRLKAKNRERDEETSKSFENGDLSRDPAFNGRRPGHGAHGKENG